MVDWSRRSYSKEDFISAWVGSSSYREVIDKLGLRVSGGATRIVKETGSNLGLPDISYSSRAESYELIDILVEDSPYRSTTGLKRRLWREGILPKECSASYCPFKGTQILDPFSGEPSDLPLVLDHIDGNPRNNSLGNLRILCQHCHTFTPTWCGKNRVANKVTLQCTCGNSITKYSKSGLCRSCTSKNSPTKIEWPSDYDLKELTESLGFSGAGRLLGVSDNAIRKRLRSRGLL